MADLKNVQIENLKKYVSENIGTRDPDSLSVHDPIYLKVKNTRIIIEGRRLSVEEKFSIIGYPRKAKFSYGNDQKIKYLKSLFDEAVENGLNVDDLKIGDELYKKIKNTDIIIDGRSVSLEEKFRLIGHPRTLKKFVLLRQLEQFKDHDGYVDSYRANGKINNFIDTLSENYKVPVPVIIELFANQKLREKMFYVDKIEVLKILLKKYVDKYGDFTGISQKDRKLYQQLLSLKKVFNSGSGRLLTTGEVIESLGVPLIKNKFKEFTNEKFIDLKSEVNNIKMSLSNNEVRRVDIPNWLYRTIEMYSRRKGISLHEFFNGYGLDYVDYKKYDNLNFVIVKKYPYIDEMKKDRDDKVNEYNSKNGSASAEERFEAYIRICNEVYDSYRDKIANYDKEDLVQNNL